MVNISFEQGQNGRLILTPESRAMIMEMHPWERYTAYHDYCRQIYRQNNPAGQSLPEPQVSNLGHQVLPNLISPEDVAALQQLLDERVDGPNLDADGNPMWFASLPWTMMRINVVRQVLGRMFAGDISKALEAYFGSYFRIMSLSLVRGFPGKADGSFLWHRDYQPPQQFHLMVYLTDSNEEGGGTTFLNFEDTKAAAYAGIHFQSMDKERFYSIKDMEAKVGRPMTTYRPEMTAGDGVMFAAPRILHQGNRPKAGQRDTLQLLMLPSPVPWDEYLAREPGRVFVSEHPGAAFFEPFEGTGLAKNDDVPVCDWAVATMMFPPGYEG